MSYCCRRTRGLRLHDDEGCGTAPDDWSGVCGRARLRSLQGCTVMTYTILLNHPRTSGGKERLQSESYEWTDWDGENGIIEATVSREEREYRKT